jgi:hypothetical protein
VSSDLGEDRSETILKDIIIIIFQLRTAAFQGLLFQLSPPGVSTHVTTREYPAAEGGTVDEKFPGILPKCRLPRYI